jgi:putative membrane protein
MLFFFTACTPMDGDDGRGGGWHMGPGMMGGYGIMGIIFWIVIIVGVVFLVKYLMQSGGREGRSGSSGSSALDILEQRYARGEIDQEEFEAKKRELSR